MKWNEKEWTESVQWSVLRIVLRAVINSGYFIPEYLIPSQWRNRCHSKETITLDIRATAKFRGRIIAPATALDDL